MMRAFGGRAGAIYLNYMAPPRNAALSHSGMVPVRRKPALPSSHVCCCVRPVVVRRGRLVMP